MLRFDSDEEKKKRREYAKQNYAKLKAERDFLKKWKEENPEAYKAKLNEITAKEDFQKKIVSDFREMIGGEYFKAVSVHVCADLMCECGIREIPALHSPVMRQRNVCNDCGQTYSALLYNVGHLTEDQHSCDKFGIFVMTPKEFKNKRDIDSLYHQWKGKVMLSGGGESKSKNNYGHVTLDRFKPTKALFVVCNKCTKAADQGVVSFAEDEGRRWNSTPLDLYESPITCLGCAGDITKYPYAWEIRDWEILFSSDHGFDWKYHYDSQRDELEQKYYKYKDLLEGLDKNDNGS